MCAGIDLSPYFLAVGAHMQRQRQQQRAAAGLPPERLRFLHAAGEDTGLPDESFDLVSVMLVGLLWVSLDANLAPAKVANQHKNMDTPNGNQ